MKIKWSLLALNRVEEIARYIAADKPGAARKWVARIFDQVKIIEDFPKSGRMVPELERDDVRELLFGQYRIIYRLKNNQIEVLTVRHGKQILPVKEIWEQLN